MTNQEAIEDIEKNILPVVGGRSLLMAISALQAQEAKAQLSAEGTTSDLISRQDAIEVIEEMQMPIMRSMFPEEQFVFKGMSEALSAIKDLPSAHPEIEERKEESAQNVPKEDLISRKVAIDAINKALDRETLLNSFVRKVAVDALKTMPSAQPEIIRCKDCKHFRTYYHGTESDTAITHACVWFLDREMGLEDYCSKGVIR